MLMDRHVNGRRGIISICRNRCLILFDLNIARIACMLVLGRGLIFIFS